MIKLKMKLALKLGAVASILALSWGLVRIVMRKDKKVASPAATEWQFVVASDIHNDLKNLKRVLEKAKEKRVAWVAVTGDLTNGGSEAELRAVKEVLDNGGVKYVTVPGNHDDWQGTKEKRDIYAAVFGDRYRSFYDQGWKFILMDNSDWRGLGEEQKEWMTTEVAECPRIKCLVMMHMPLNNAMSDHVMGEYVESTAQEAEAMVKLLVENKVVQVYAGHLHIAMTYELEGLRTMLVGAVTEARSQRPEYVEVSIKGETKRDWVTGIE